MAKLQALAKRRRATLRLSVHKSASKVNCSGGDTQVFRHCYLVVFHPFVEKVSLECLLYNLGVSSVLVTHEISFEVDMRHKQQCRSPKNYTS